MNPKDKLKKKILIIEDEMPIKNALCNKLYMEGFDTLDASDGEEGLEKALQEKPDLILLDVFMPKMNGKDMLEKLRKDEFWGSHAKVMILTNSVAMLSEDHDIKNLNPTETLMKSDISLEELVEKIKKHLEV